MMLSLSRGMSAGQAGGYFSREDYYLKEKALERNSCWYGKGAEVLGLRGPVEKEKLHALCAGRDPATGMQLVASGYSREEDRRGRVYTLRGQKGSRLHITQK